MRATSKSYLDVEVHLRHRVVKKERKLHKHNRKDKHSTAGEGLALSESLVYKGVNGRSKPLPCEMTLLGLFAAVRRPISRDFLHIQVHHPVGSMALNCCLAED